MNTTCGDAVGWTALVGGNPTERIGRSRVNWTVFARKSNQSPKTDFRLRSAFQLSVFQRLPGWSLVTCHLSLLFTVPIIHDEFQGTRVTPNVYTTLRGVLTPQARTAHQPTHDSKPQKSPIRIKIAASRRDSEIRHAPASKNATAMPPRAARPLLSMFCLIVEGSQHEVVE